MKFFTYLSYFFHVAWNWNLRLAFFTLFHEVRGEARYQLDTTGTRSLETLETRGKYKDEAEVYQGASYYLLEKLFGHLKSLGVTDSLVDFGCGKGRVLIVAAHYQFKKIVGVEFAKELYEKATRNIAAAAKTFPDVSFHVDYQNAVNYVIDGSTQVFFFFNPFKAPVMKKVIENLIRSQRRWPRKLYVMYVNPQLRELFVQAGFKEIFYDRKMKFVEGCILVREGEEFRHRHR